MEYVLKQIINDTELHARWLATLSELELCGARKIASYIPKTLHQSGQSWTQDLDLLQHAAEEFRHAYFFQKQIAKLQTDPQVSRKLHGRRGARYLHLLDLSIARHLRQKGLSTGLNKACYLLTTYAIEKRAQDIYGCYQSLLQTLQSPVSVRSVIAEEVGHLCQIEKALAENPLIDSAKEEVRELENKIFVQFWKEIEDEIALTLHEPLVSLELANSHPMSKVGSL